MREPLATCINVTTYASDLVYGQAYPILDRDDTPDRPMIKVRGARGRVRWYPAGCFDLSGAAATAIAAVTIRDDLAASHERAIEVDILLSTGERRWCAFSTPEALTKYGDLLSDSAIRLHYGNHLIILTELTEQSIHQALDYLLIHGQLLAHTQPLSLS